MLTALIALIPTGDLSGVVLDRGRPVANAAVWLSGDFASTPKRAVIDQRNLMFQPHVEVVPVGSTIDFPNHDDVFHNVYAEFQAKRFDLGSYPKGSKKSVRFDKEGVVSVLCNVHSSMSAYIVVVDTPYFAKTDRQGRFSIHGNWRTATLHAWHESGKTAKMELSGQSSVQVDLHR